MCTDCVGLRWVSGVIGVILLEIDKTVTKVIFCHKVIAFGEGEALVEPQAFTSSCESIANQHKDKGRHQYGGECIGMRFYYPPAGSKLEAFSQN